MKKFENFAGLDGPMLLDMIDEDFDQIGISKDQVCKFIILSILSFDYYHVPLFAGDAGKSCCKVEFVDVHT
jgi:hypothetical protein